MSQNQRKTYSAGFSASFIIWPLCKRFSNFGCINMNVALIRLITPIALKVRCATSSTTREIALSTRWLERSVMSELRVWVSSGSWICFSYWNAKRSSENPIIHSIFARVGRMSAQIVDRVNAHRYSIGKALCRMRKYRAYRKFCWVSGAIFIRSVKTKINRFVLVVWVRARFFLHERRFEGKIE